LVFLPGVGEIRRVGKALADRTETHGMTIVELYGDLPPDRQDAALQSCARRKIVLATNVAETSVTVPGVTAVVDAGLARIMEFDPSVGLDRLVLRRISQASADQRTGRAGRTAPGLCLRLWTEREQRLFAARTEPEIRRVDLAGPVLQLHAWGETDARRFGWFEAPKEAALVRAEELLHMLGAVDSSGKITACGRRLAALPAHPRLVRLLETSAELGCLDEGAVAAALLAERDPFDRETRPAHPPPSASDLLDRVHALETFARNGSPRTDIGFLHVSAARQVLAVAEQFHRETERACGPCKRAEHPDEALRRALLAAYPDRVVKRRNAGDRRGVMVGGRGVTLDPTSAVVEAELFLAVEVLAGGAEDRVTLASAVERAWLPSARIALEEVADFDQTTGRATARRLTKYRDLVIDETRLSHVSDDSLAAALMQAAMTDLHAALGLDRPEVAGFLARVGWLREWMPELELPAFDDAELAEILPPLCVGKRSLVELRSAPVLDFLKAKLTHAQATALEREAPLRLGVPSGSQIALQYEPGKPPILAVRIQEVFGLADTPKLAAGRAAVLLHLLAPNYRPQQVTQDLRSFWNGAYGQIRKELRARYPKHAWPEDPWTAPPQRGAKRR
jgi:ATP-dependent helicase HrpB